MSVLYVLISVSLFVATVFFVAFIWATRAGQFDDAKTPSMRILFEDDDVLKKERINGG